MDICGSSDVKFFDFEPEDDDDPEEADVADVHRCPSMCDIS